MTRPAKTPGMVLPPHERTDGEIRQDWLSRDVRVPRPLREVGEDGWRDEHPARVAGHSPYADDRCHDGRHLFDVIESTHVRYIEREDGSEDEEIDFRARLTCVRCGKVLGWEGTRTEEHVARVDPVPIQAGDLLAQQVQQDHSYRRDMSTWHVYRDGQQVGKITWGCGPRGRAFYSGRLEEWSPGVAVEAKDPAAVLRKLARTAAVEQAS